MRLKKPVGFFYSQNTAPLGRTVADTERTVDVSVVLVERSANDSKAVHEDTEPPKRITPCWLAPKFVQRDVLKVLPVGEHDHDLPVGVNFNANCVRFNGRSRHLNENLVACQKSPKAFCSENRERRSAKRNFDRKVRRRVPGNGRNAKRPIRILNKNWSAPRREIHKNDVSVIRNLRGGGVFCFRVVTRRSVLRSHSLSPSLFLSGIQGREAQGRKKGRLETFKLTPSRGPRPTMGRHSTLQFPFQFVNPLLWACLDKNTKIEYYI